MARKSPISKHLKEARLAAKISQKKLGIAAGIDEFVASPRMNQYETGKHVPDFTILQKIAKALKIPPAYFYTQEDTLAKIIQLYEALSQKKKEQLLTFAEKLSNPKVKNSKSLKT